MLQYCMENKTRIFDQIFGIRDFFRLDFGGFLEYFGGDFWTIVGGVLYSLNTVLVFFLSFFWRS